MTDAIEEEKNESQSSILHTSVKHKTATNAASVSFPSKRPYSEVEREQEQDGPHQANDEHYTLS